MRRRLTPIMLFAASCTIGPFCGPPWFAGNWVGADANHNQLMKFTVTCPGAPAQSSAACATLSLPSAPNQPSGNYTLELSDPIASTCSGTMNVNGPDILISTAMCSGDFTLTRGVLALAADPNVTAFTSAFRGTITQNGQLCSVAVEGPLYLSNTAIAGECTPSVASTKDGG